MDKKMFKEIKRKMDAAEDIMAQLKWKVDSVNSSVESLKEEMKECDESSKEWMQEQLEDYKAFLDMVEAVKDFLMKEVKKSI